MGRSLLVGELFSIACPAFMNPRVNQNPDIGQYNLSIQNTSLQGLIIILTGV